MPEIDDDSQGAKESNIHIGDLYKTVTSIDVVKASLPEGQVEVIVSTPNKDRQGENINIDGIDLQTMKTNAPVMWSHDYTLAPIGRIEKLWKTAGVLKARVEFALKINPMADMIYQMVKDGFIKAVSIGGIVKEFGKNVDGTTDYTNISKMEMIELSFCAIGANPEALVTLKALESDNIRLNNDSSLEAILKSVLALESNASAMAATLKSVIASDRQDEAKEKTARRVTRPALSAHQKQTQALFASINSLSEGKTCQKKQQKQILKLKQSKQ